MKTNSLDFDAQALREKILDLAMRGKLVQQDPNDEPASVLLEKIKAEKEQLIKEKKIKKSKLLPPISDEEKPFEIPDSWEWVRLGDIGAWAAGATPSRKHPEYYGGTIPWLKTGDLNDGIVKMANLAVIASHSVNGVSKLHSEILKGTVFKDFYSVMPDKFKNVTN